MSTILVDGDYVVDASQNLTFTAASSVPVYTLDGYAVYLSNFSPPVLPDPTFTDYGSISVTSSDASASIIALGDNGYVPYSGSLIEIAAGGSLTVAATGSSSFAYGSKSGARLENDGNFSVSATWYAYGAYEPGQGFNNTGVFSVSADTAVGLLGGGSAAYVNSGTMTVTGGTSATAFFISPLGYPSTSVTNSGTITVTATSGISYGFYYTGDSSSTLNLTNTGSITAQHAIYEWINVSPAQTPTLHLENSGTINGDIVLGLGPTTDYYPAGTFAGSQINNTGAINGAVHLDTNGNDLYDGRGGTQTGGIYLGAGTDTVYLGNDGETVYGGSGVSHVMGGTGSDTFVGGAGNDVVDGGGGNDVLDGGGGSNTASFASAATGVTVSLALQGSAQATGVSSITLSNFQNILGSVHDDHLTGDANNNVIDGGGGNDVIDGGGGSNTVSFASAAAGVTISLALQGSAQAVGTGSVTFTNIQNLTGSAFSDHLTGDANDNVIDGGSGGNDVLDGGGGTNTVSFASATSGVTIGLAQQGAALTVGTGSVTFTNFENLTGSAYADHLTGDAGDNVIDGGGAADVLDGGGGINTLSFASAATGVTASLALQGQAQNTGAGTVTASNFQNLTGSAFNDILQGDSGSNVLTGGAGADIFVITPNGGSDTIADLSTQGDRVDLSAFAGFYDFDAVLAAATSSGPDTIINLGNGSTVTLANVAKSSLAAADFTLSPILIPISSSTVTLAAGHATGSASGPAVIFQASSGGTFINQGTMTVSTTGSAQGVITAATGADPTAVFENDGTFTFTAGMQGPPAYNGYNAAVEVVTLKNNGAFSATIGDYATGASGDLINTGSYVVQGASAATGDLDGNTGGLVQNLVGATLSVSATSGPAMGVIFMNGGEFDNAGALTVAGASQTNAVSVGVRVGDRDYTASSYSKVVNSGSITVTGAASSHGVEVGDVIALPYGAYNLINSGSITAPIAVYSGSIGVSVDNTGTLNGDVELGQGGGILNTGVINGNVDFSYGLAFLNSTGGVVHGTIFIGPGGSSSGGRILLGAEDNTVVIGDLGTNTIDGGGGTNTVSFTTATPIDTRNDLSGGVVVSLLTQGAPQQASNAGTLTLSNIQNLVGSAYSDHLIGGTETNALTGGGGADMFMFAPGAGAETVTDFSPAQGDKIELLSGFSQLASLANVLAAAHQVGADTVIAIGSGSLTLKNVAVASLTASDFMLSAPTVGPGLGGTPTTGGNVFVAMTLTGTSHDDWLQGGVGDDTLHGGAGSDYLSGGGGVNTAAYDGARSQYTIGAGAAGEVTVSGGPEGGTDILVNIQRIQFSDGAVATNPTADVTLGTSDQMLIGTRGNDWLVGGTGNDTLYGGPGSDHLDGATGQNTALYDGAYRQYAVTIGATTTIGGGPEGGTDDLLNIQHVQFVDGYLTFSPTDPAGQVYRLYEATLNRAPDQEGLTNWVNALNSGASLQSVVNGFVNSTEFRADYGANLSNSDFVTLLYHNVLHRDPDQAGLTNWVNMLNTGQDTRAQVVTGFSESTEDINDLAAPVQQGLWIANPDAGEVARLYDTVLGRLPDGSGLANWTHSLESGASLQSVADGFVGSAEFQAVYGTLNNSDFVTLLYHNVLHRDPDQAGLTNWVSNLASGETRAQVVVGFSESAEHITNTAAHVDSGIWLAG